MFLNDLRMVPQQGDGSEEGSQVPGPFFALH